MDALDADREPRELDTEATFYCAFCGEPNTTDVDWSAGRKQSYVEDCQVCCQPNVLTVFFDTDGDASIQAEPES